MPEPPPPPPPAYEAKQFIVYFPFDQYILTPEAQTVVQEAANYASAGRATYRDDAQGFELRPYPRHELVVGEIADECAARRRGAERGERADAAGDTQVWGLLGCQKEAAFAASRVIVVVEELVEADPRARLISQTYLKRFEAGTARGEFTLILPSPGFEAAGSEPMVE